MPEIVVTVKNKMAVGDGSVIVCNNSDYVVRFVLDSEWDALALRTMRIVYDSYTHTDIAFSGDTVALPAIIDRTSIGIGLYSGDIHTSTCAMFDCERSVMGNNSHAVAPPSSDVYNEIVEMINDGRLKGDKGADGTNGADGANGADGVTFTPSVDSAGNLSWTNDGGLSNPATVNIKGATGATGERGEQGIPGERGAQGAKGDKGDKGETGAKGDKGDKGDKGEPGADGAPGKDGSDANVTAQNIEAALGYVPVTPSDLAAKQDVLTDADRQSITKIGMTTGAAWTADEQKAARERMGVDKPYELIEEIVLEEEVRTISRSPFSYPCTSVLGCVTLPVINSSFGFYMEAYLNTNVSNVVGNMYGSSEGSEEIRFEETVKNGVLTGTSQGRVRGWGSGTLYGVNNAASLFFCEAIIGVCFYTPDSGKNIPAGTKIKIYGVRA